MEEIKVNLIDNKVIWFWYFFLYVKLYNYKNVIGIIIFIIKEICYRVNYKSKIIELNLLEIIYLCMNGIYFNKKVIFIRDNCSMFVYVN